MYNMIIYDYLVKKGGPSGYLYNLKDSTKINIISRGTDVSDKKTKKLKKLKKIRQYLKEIKSLIRKNKKREKFFNVYSNTINNAKVNHFHSTTIYHGYYKLYNNNSINILTTHSPQPTYLELKDKLTEEGFSFSNIEKRVKKQKEIDTFSLTNADYIIFPCKEALSPYESFFNEIELDYDKLRYVLTGVEPLIFNLNKEQFCLENKIDKNKIIISYIGRKNKIKGFDRFIDLAKRMKPHKNIIFVCAGIGMKTPKLSNLIDFGWTTDPGSIINASDFILVPNRNTYFDINMIQILSIGTPIITTATGGNRWFENKNNLNMFFFKEEEDLITLIEKKSTESFSKEINKEFYNSHFTVKKFDFNYTNMFDSLILER